MIRAVRCWIGRPKWQRRFVGDESFTKVIDVCPRCGVERGYHIGRD